jgi:D-alanyl-D-alanine carboxypeptidase
MKKKCSVIPVFFTMIFIVFVLGVSDTLGGVKGNVYGSENIVDIADAIKSLQIATGSSVSPNEDADVDSDGRIGTAETVFALQVAGGLKQQPILEKLQQLLDDAVTNSGIPGAVMIVRTASAACIVASGVSNIKTKTPMKPSDMLRIASMSKTFASTVLLKLSEEGKLSLDDTIGKYLDSATMDMITNGTEITIRQLLSMTSGIYEYYNNDDYFDAVEERESTDKWTPEEILPYIQGKPASFPPGQGWEYSNTNYILLDMIVEKISGTSLAAEMRRIIHTPLNLENIFTELQESREGGFGGLMVRGYDCSEDPPVDITEENDALGLGDGGLISDVSGLAGFLFGLFKDKRILSQDSLDLMAGFGNYVDLNAIPSDQKADAKDYGLALGRTDTTWGELWGHDGKSAGFEGEMGYLVEKQVAFAVLMNAENSPKAPVTLFEDSMKLLFE